MLSKCLQYPIKAQELTRGRTSVDAISKMHAVSLSSWASGAASGRPAALQSIAEHCRALQSTAEHCRALPGYTATAAEAVQWKSRSIRKKCHQTEKGLLFSLVTIAWETDVHLRMENRRDTEEARREPFRGPPCHKSAVRKLQQEPEV